MAPRALHRLVPPDLASGAAMIVRAPLLKPKKFKP